MISLFLGLIDKIHMKAISEMPRIYPLAIFCTGCYVALRVNKAIENFNTKKSGQINFGEVAEVNLQPYMVSQLNERILSGESGIVKVVLVAVGKMNTNETQPGSRLALSDGQTACIVLRNEPEVSAARVLNDFRKRLLEEKQQQEVCSIS